MAAYTRDDNLKWRPRRGKPTNVRAQWRPMGPAVSSASFILQDLEERITVLSAGEGFTSELVQLRHVKPVASYSWIDAPVPTILVPGSPWIWADERPAVKQVPLDAGVQYVHHNASKMGNDSPMLPLFAAIDALHDDFPYKDFDLVTDRNGLRKLFRCVDSEASQRTDDGFRIDVDLLGKTCLFTRREEDTTIVGQHTGYGHEYLKATTRTPSGCEKMLDHHRIITYRFGSLKILLGFTADACTDAKKSDDDLLASFSSLSIGAKAGGEKSAELKEPTHTDLDVRFSPSRALVPQTDLVEVKTRSNNREPNWSDIYPQLFLSQTPWLYLARHSGGVFQPVQKISLLGEEMKPYREKVEGSLGKLKNLLKAILVEARKQGEGVPLTLVYQKGTLSLWRRKEGSGKPLGDMITSKFKAK